LSLEALPEPTISPVFWLDIWASLKPEFATAWLIFLYFYRHKGLKWVVNFLKHLHKGEHLKRVVVTGKF
jgi:hypothetical protein